MSMNYFNGILKNKVVRVSNVFLKNSVQLIVLNGIDALNLAITVLVNVFCKVYQVKKKEMHLIKLLKIIGDCEARRKEKALNVSKEIRRKNLD